MPDEEEKPVESDTGQANIRIGHHDGKVLIDFGIMVRSISLTPQQARKFAELIRQNSYKVIKQTPENLVDS